MDFLKKDKRILFQKIQKYGEMKLVRGPEKLLFQGYWKLFKKTAPRLKK